MAEKEVMIACTSIQRDERGEAEQIVLETPGIYGATEEYRYIRYEETSLSGMEGTTTTIRMYNDHAVLSRSGAFLQETEFRIGEKSSSSYTTPLGEMEMVTATRRVDDEIVEGKGRLHLVFDVELKGLFTHVNEIIIDVREA